MYFHFYFQSIKSYIDGNFYNLHICQFIFLKLIYSDTFFPKQIITFSLSRIKASLVLLNTMYVRSHFLYKECMQRVRWEWHLNAMVLLHKIDVFLLIYRLLIFWLIFVGLYRNLKITRKNTTLWRRLYYKLPTIFLSLIFWRSRQNKGICQSS